MRAFLLCFLMAAATAGAAEKDPVVAAVENLFRAMAAHDEAALRALLTPAGRVLAVREGKLSEASHEDFIARIAASKETLLERMWNPEVRLDGGLATLWAPYDFHRGAKLSHCGFDSVTLVKTTEGWRIAGIAYTVTGAARCAPSPLGPPAGK
jgi:hypothetical protein